MVVTSDIHLPNDEELTVPELNISTAALKAGAFHLGKACEHENNEFMLCRQELDDPRACIKEGKAGDLNFFRSVKKTCHEEFTQYANCLDKSSGNMAFNLCRKTQGVYDKCIFDNLNIERPEYGYFCRAKIHHTDRPAPPTKEGKEDLSRCNSIFTRGLPSTTSKIRCSIPLARVNFALLAASD